MVETNWEESIINFKRSLFQFNNDLLPSSTKLRVFNGPELLDTQKVGDMCLA